jgi:hypothetical protein
MSPTHRSSSRRHQRVDRADQAPARAVPFFEFMLYGARAYAAGRSASRLVCVTRGRVVTLIEAPPPSLPADPTS